MDAIAARRHASFGNEPLGLFPVRVSDTVELLTRRIGLNRLIFLKPPQAAFRAKTPLGANLSSGRRGKRAVLEWLARHHRAAYGLGEGLSARPNAQTDPHAQARRGAEETADRAITRASPSAGHGALRRPAHPQESPSDRTQVPV